MLGGRRASRGVGRSAVECVEILEGQLSHVITIAMAHAQHGPFVWRTRRLWRRATHGLPPPATTPRGRLSWLPPLTFFFFSSTRRSRVGWGDTGPGPLVALHGTPQRETSAAQRGLCRRSDYATHGSPSMATSLLRVLLWDTL